MGKLDGSEQILCMVAADVKRRFGPWTGYRRYDHAVTCETGWLSRTDELEANPQVLQVIAYGSVWRVAGSIPRVLVYERAKAGTEKRLHGAMSLGLGGHINVDDGPAKYDVDMRAMQREIAEELGVYISQERMYRTGLIYDESWTGVNAVHIGVYFETTIPDFHVSDIKSEDSIKSLGWWSHEDIRRQFVCYPDQWETWSQVVIRNTILQDLLVEKK